MTDVVQAGGFTELSLPVGKTLTVTPATGAAGTLVRQGDTQGEAPQSTTTLSSATPVTVGPYAVTTFWRITCSAWSIAYAMAGVDFPTLAEVQAATIPLGTSQSIGDVKLYVGAGAPVDYTDGSPPATGEGEAGIGSIYVNITSGKLYLNGGTKAQPIWKIVTSA